MTKYNYHDPNLPKPTIGQWIKAWIITGALLFALGIAALVTLEAMNCGWDYAFQLFYDAAHAMCRK